MLPDQLLGRFMTIGLPGIDKIAWWLRSGMSERKYIVALYAFVPFGPARMELLLSYFGSAKKAWQASSSELHQIGLRKAMVEAFSGHRKSFDFQKYFRRLNQLSINFLTKEDNHYPGNLFDLPNAPFVLYYKGRLKPCDSEAIAIVGTRKMTTYGREVARQFAFGLANFGVTIVSGLAMGIDTVAHEAAIEAQGRTIAVLGCGLDMVYPARNLSLVRKIIKKNLGAIVSEYPLGYPALRNNFASRNRIISGLSKAVLVVEGKKKSGTLLTAAAAADQGRQVFAVPGQINSPMSQAPFFLIKNGAKMATSHQDILEELNLQLKVDREQMEKILPTDKIEKKLFQILENEPLHLDEIARRVRLSVKEVSAKLTMMELKRVVKNLGDGVYGK